MKLIQKTIRVIDHMRTGAKAREARKRAGLTLGDVCRRMGVSDGYLCELELGKANWSAEMFERFAKALKEL